MKKTLIIGLLLGLMLPMLYGFQRTRSGDQIQSTVLVTPSAKWDITGTITAVNATLGVAARDYSAVWTDLPDANTITWDVPNDVTGIFLRAQTDADADAHVVEMWVSAGATYRDGTTEDSFMLGAIFTLTGGKQVGPSTNVFVDTLAVTATTGILDSGVVLDNAADRVVLYRIDLQGWKKVVFIATTFEAATTLQMDARWY